LKNKTKTYALLVLVFTIWGIIGFKMFSAIKPEIPEQVNQQSTILFIPKTDISGDVFSIQPSERDPFLGTLYTKKQTKKKSKSKVEKQELVWVPIVYHGIVSSSNNKEGIYILSIQGKQHLVKIGQTINNVKLLRATRTEILVQFKGVRKFIAKS
jgi:type II secretory pathway component PulC